MYFLFNFWMNLWVLFLCRFFLHSKVKKRKVIFYAFAGTLGEVVVICLPIASSSWKIGLGFGGITALVCYMVFRPEDKRFFYKILMHCYLSAFLLGGILLSIESIMRKNKISYLPLGILIFLIVLWIENTYKKWNRQMDFCEVKLYFSTDSYCDVKALIDTGNGLIEPISNVPVSILEGEVAEKYKHSLREENYRLVPFHSIGMDKGVLEAYFVEKMIIKKEGEKIEIKKPMIAIAKDAISVNGKYEMILHPNIIG